MNIRQNLKILTLSSLLFSSVLSAEIVTAEGYGDDFDSALRNAKLAALENVVGTFIIGGREWQTDDTVFEKIKEYHGGYIKSYEILEYKNDRITIKADVDKIKDNRMHVDGNTVDVSKYKTQIENYNSRKEIIKELDDPAKAFFVKINNMQLDPVKDKVQFRITGTLQWQPKWLSDLETFVTTTDDVGNTHTDLNERISGTTLSIMSSYGPIGAVIGTVAYKSLKTSHETTDSDMVCFAKKTYRDIEYCYDLAGGFKNMPVYSELPAEILAIDSKGKEIFSQRINIKAENMYENMYKGQTKKTFITKRTFDQPTFIIYTDAERVFTVAFKVDAGLASTIDKIIIRPKL